MLLSLIKRVFLITLTTGSRTHRLYVSALDALTDATILNAIAAWLSNPSLATALYGHINSWNTSLVTYMESLFDHDYKDSSRFNEDLSRWDTSRVTNMNYVFYYASSFNGNISTWNTSRVVTISGMFNGAASFNGNLSLWDVSRIVDMNSVFPEATSFNGDVSTWDTSSVTDMRAMFRNAVSFHGDISRWNTSRVTSFDWMFTGATSFNQTLCWNVSNVTNFEYMFSPGSSARLLPYPSCTQHLLPPTRSPLMEQTLKPSTRPSPKPTIWPRPWITHSSKMYGVLMSDAIEGHRSCPPGSMVTKIFGFAGSWIFQLSAMCNDSNNTLLGPWGAPQGYENSVHACDEGYTGWTVAYGAYIAHLSFSCASSTHQSYGNTIGYDPLDDGNVSREQETLTGKQRVIGFHTYYSTLGMQAMMVEYADVGSTTKIVENPTNHKRLALLCGLLTTLALLVVCGALIVYLRRQQQRNNYKRNDLILPLK